MEAEALDTVIGIHRSFDTEAGQWQDVDLPFQQFIPIFRAKTKPDAAPLNKASITSVQVIVKVFGDGGAGCLAYLLAQHI